jgi:hypothetical protein
MSYFCPCERQRDHEVCTCDFEYFGREETLFSTEFMIDAWSKEQDSQTFGKNYTRFGVGRRVACVYVVFKWFLAVSADHMDFSSLDVYEEERVRICNREIVFRTRTSAHHGPLLLCLILESCVLVLV